MASEKMLSLERSIKSQFERIFNRTDWHLFKIMAELNLKQAAELKKKDMPISEEYRLVARNSRKRLLIGVGMELLLKSVYLKHGYMINIPHNSGSLKFPFSASDIGDTALDSDKTYGLNELISKLHEIIQMKGITKKG